jgi:Ferritin-like
MRSYLHVVRNLLHHPQAGPAFLAAATDELLEGSQPTHAPRLVPRDEAAFLLNAAAEIEHALMVQYLFAAYSIRIVDGDPRAADLGALQQQLLQIAREEMGHLMTVENLLVLIGAPLNFYREHSPFASEIYPFRFKLEPLSLASLAKYVVAESPVPLPPDLPEADRDLYATCIDLARLSNDGHDVLHVGPIFARLKMLFEAGPDGLADEDFRLDRAAFQGTYQDWGFDQAASDGDPRPADNLIVESFPHPEVGPARAAALAAIAAVGLQGEGFDIDTEGIESHFERFFVIFKTAKRLADEGVALAWPVPVNPNTTREPAAQTPPGMMLEAVMEAHEAKGRITDPRALSWAHLFNLRYRLLLGYLQHFLRGEEPLFVPDGAGRGDRTARGLLAMRTFDEMRHLKKIAGKLVQLPQTQPETPARAGPPFELPYTLILPDRPEDRWRAHLDATRASLRLVHEHLLAPGAEDLDDPFLADLAAADEKAVAAMGALAAGQALPPDALPTALQKAATILEEAVRGFTIGQHGNFWADKPRDAFIAQGPWGGAWITPGNAEDSELIERIENRASDPSPDNRMGMPRHRPAIPEPRRAFLRDWIDAGCPDGEPPDQPGVHHERSPNPEPSPTPPPEPPTAPSFESDIKPLFRPFDRNSMRFLFDLSSYDDVRANSDRILARLENGSMPCDGAWPASDIEQFRAWIAAGFPA